LQVVTFVIVVMVVKVLLRIDTIDRKSVWDRQNGRKREGYERTSFQARRVHGFLRFCDDGSDEVGEEVTTEGPLSDELEREPACVATERRVGGGREAGVGSGGRCGAGVG
jgi:hypothetical protein